MAENSELVENSVGKGEIVTRMATPEGFRGREMREGNSFKDKAFFRTIFGIIY